MLPSAFQLNSFVTFMRIRDSSSLFYLEILRGYNITYDKSINCRQFPVICRQIKQILEQTGNMCVTGMVVNGEEAVAFAKKRRPDVIAIDSGIQRIGVYEATRMIMETCPVPVVVVVEGYQRGDIEKSFHAMDAGAVAVVEKPFDAAGNAIDAETVKNFIETIRLMSEIKVVRRWSSERRTRSSPVSLPEAERKTKIVAIGASTGGPPLYSQYFHALRRTFLFPCWSFSTSQRTFWKAW